MFLCDPMDCSPPGFCSWDSPGKQEYWSGLLCPSLRDLPDPGIQPVSNPSSLPLAPPGIYIHLNHFMYTWNHYKSTVFQYFFKRIIKPLIRQYLSRAGGFLKVDSGERRQFQKSTSPHFAIWVCSDKTYSFLTLKQMGLIIPGTSGSKRTSGAWAL